MKVHLNQIPQEGLHIEGEEDSAFLEVEKDWKNLFTRSLWTGLRFRLKLKVVKWWT